VGPNTLLVSETEYLLLLGSRPELVRRPDLLSVVSDAGSQSSENEEIKEAGSFCKHMENEYDCVMTEPEEEF